MIKLVVFDMAGTVINEDNVVYKTLQKAANKGGIEVNLNQVLEIGAGKEKSNALRDIAAQFAPSMSPDSIHRIFNEFLVMLESAYRDLNILPMQGAEELFFELRKRKILVALNTGYNKTTSDQLLSKLGWSKPTTVDEIVTASDVLHTRPFPDMIFFAMESLGIYDGKLVMKVGDSQIDIEEGKNAGCAVTVGVTTGANTRDQLVAAKPDFVIDQLSEILNVL